MLYHGGGEGYAYPSPEVEKTLPQDRGECGASLVVCQYGHCVGSSERWNNATIVYGQGNFIFDFEDDAKGTIRECLWRYTIGDYGADKVDYVPIVRESAAARRWRTKRKPKKALRV